MTPNGQMSKDRCHDTQPAGPQSGATTGSLIVLHPFTGMRFGTTGDTLQNTRRKKMEREEGCKGWEREGKKKKKKRAVKVSINYKVRLMG